MKRLMWSLAGVAVLGMTCSMSAVAEESRTIRGEIIDPAGYLKTGAHGADTASQTYEALDGGQTLALLDESGQTLYLLLAEEPGEDPNELVYDYANQLVNITGVVYERGGVHGLVAKSVEPVNPPSSTPAGAASTDTDSAPAAEFNER